MSLDELPPVPKYGKVGFITCCHPIMQSVLLLPWTDRVTLSKCLELLLNQSRRNLRIVWLRVGQLESEKYGDRHSTG